MAVKRSPQQQMRLAVLETMDERLQHIHALVEKFATAREGHELLAQPIRRAFGTFKLALSAAGFDQMAHLAAGMEIAARRGGSPLTKGRILRDGVGSLRSQIELEQRAILAADDEADPADDADAAEPPGTERTGDPS